MKTRTSARYLLALSQSISQLGSLFTSFAISWIIIEGGRSAGWLAAYLSYATFLYAVFSLVAGRILDRFNRKKVIAASELLSAIALVFLSIAEASGFAGMGLYFGISFITQLSGTLVMIGTQSVIGEFGEGAEVAKVQASFEIIRRIFTVGSPLLAGLLVAALPRWGIFAMDAASYLVSMAGALAFIPPCPDTPNKPAAPLIKILIPGFSRSSRIGSMATLVIGINLIYAPVLLLWPLLTKELSGGPFLMGLLSGSFIAGSIAGGLWVLRAREGDLWHQGYQSLLIISISFIVMSLFSRLPSVFLCIPVFTLGAGFGSVNGPMMGIIHSLLPREEKGTFFGWLGFAGQIGQPLAISLCGLLAVKAGVSAILIAAAAGGLASALSFRRAQKFIKEQV